ncbi:DoxX family protein [Sphingobacteriaceae bacterium WQ 2009]|uniref:DoxX family protein n=1 Tax=Rhinopithecimicrobium faecis TaxID=2820698 RepID=A0A8T4H7K8_9SPHI|nr:DoxX family protein [Sphingobacteriaceae bacterium WQ 2009]
MQKSFINPDLGILLIRIATGGLMLFHGVHKAFHGHDHIIGMLSDHGLPTWLWLGVPLGEIVAPILVIVGLLARFSGLLIAITMLVAMYLAYGAASFTLTASGGITTEFDLYFIFAGIALFFTGSGKYAIYRGANSWLQ